MPLRSLSLSLLASLTFASSCLARSEGFVVERSKVSELDVAGPVFVTERSNHNEACAALSADTTLSKRVLYPGDLVYTYESQHYYDGRSAANVPACVFLPKSAKDVSTAVIAAKAANSKFAVKSGGHTGNGDAQWSSTAGGVLIDLKDLNDISLNLETETAFVGAGNRFINIYEALGPANRTVVGGRLSDVGIGGWSVGGGLSYLSAKYGLGADNYVSLEVVLPDGKIVNATATNKYSDLFWALKGGGNQFGIVTTFEFIAHDIPLFYAGDVTYSIDQVDAVVKATQNFAATYPDDKAAIITTITKVSGDLPVIIVFLIYMGEKVPHGVFDEFLAIPHLTDTRSVKTYLEVCTMNDFGNLEIGQAQAFWSVPISTDRLQEAYAIYNKWAIDYALDYSLVTLDLQPIPKSLVHAGRKAGGNPIFSGKEENFIWLNFLINGYNPLFDTLLMPAALNWTKSVGAQPGYPTFLNDANHLQKAVQSYAGYHKLVEIKKKYDPEGFFTKNTGGPRY